MNGIVGIAKARQSKLVTKMLETIAHRGKEKGRVIETNVATLGCVWTPYHRIRESMFEHPALDYAYGQVFRQTPPTPNELAREVLPFALALVTPNGLLLARDALGVRPLYYGYTEDNAFCFASEVKALIPYVKNVQEFPPGFMYSESNGWEQFIEWQYGDTLDIEPAEAANELRQKLDQAVERRVISEVMGSWLSGGIDSSAIAALAKPKVKELHTFAGGRAGSTDLEQAQFMASYLGTIHHELIISDEILVNTLAEVIWALESFDALLVRSSVVNYLVSKLATDFVDVVLSGEGGDELFAGYDYLKNIESENLQEELLDITGSLHNTALQRVDRCASAFGLLPQVPFLDRNVLEFAIRLPVDYKLPKEPPRLEKWILRRALDGLLPTQILERRKEKFWAGAGIGTFFAELAEQKISDSEFARERVLKNGWQLSSKEELMYYRIFREAFGEQEDLNWMGRSKVTPS
ncbi:MAG: asparagine synthase-related protein [Anaerolineales bacterium]